MLMDLLVTPWNKVYEAHKVQKNLPCPTQKKYLTRTNFWSKSFATVHVGENHPQFIHDMSQLEGPETICLDMTKSNNEKVF